MRYWFDIWSTGSEFKPSDRLRERLIRHYHGDVVRLTTEVLDEPAPWGALYL